MLKILIVDDEPTVCAVLEEFLVEKGYETDTANSGEKALEMLIAKHHDLMLLDLNMPGMSGLEVLREVERKAYQVGVIIITGLQDLELARKVIRHGAIDYLNKPIDLELLASAIDFALKKRRIIQKVAG